MTEDQQRREADADRAAPVQKGAAETDAADPNKKADTTQEAAVEPPD